MPLISELVKQGQILALIIIILGILTLNQFLWHRRQMQIIEKKDYRRPNTRPPTQIFQPAGIGLVVCAIGLGGVIEVAIEICFDETFGGSIILLLAGGTLAGYSLCLQRAIGNQGHENGDQC